MLEKKHIPNLLTGARIVAVPLALVVMVLGHSPLALLWIFVLASISDYLDGYLARKWNVISPLGVMLDPMADKLLVAVMLLHLLNEAAVPLLLVALILLREMYVAGLRDYLGSRNVALPVSAGGKWKTATQMLAITLLLFCQAYQSESSAMLGYGLLWASAILACISAYHYSRSAWRHVR